MSIRLIIHDVRSTLNVGALLRTAEGLGVERVALTGYTPYPLLKVDPRLPHLAARIDKKIDKTALGAAQYITWRYEPDVMAAIANDKADGYYIVALEQDRRAQELPQFQRPERTTLIVGNEVAGLDAAVLEASETILCIPMDGRKESFNVASAAAMALYQLRHRP